MESHLPHRMRLKCPMSNARCSLISRGRWCTCSSSSLESTELCLSVVSASSSVDSHSSRAHSTARDLRADSRENRRVRGIGKNAGRSINVLQILGKLCVCRHIQRSTEYSSENKCIKSYVTIDLPTLKKKIDTFFVATVSQFFLPGVPVSKLELSLVSFNLERPVGPPRRENECMWVMHRECGQTCIS